MTGDWTWSSDEEEEGAGGEGRETKEKDEDWQPEKDVGKKKTPGDGRKGSDLKKVCKRRLFSNKKDYMDDSAESGKEEESHEDESRKKYGRTRKGVLNTVQKLKKEGSLPDLCEEKAATPAQGWSLRGL